MLVLGALRAVHLSVPMLYHKQTKFQNSLHQASFLSL
jgi:hypothetical protein